MIMDCYDENLQDSKFFQELVQRSSNILQESTVSKILICVPRQGSFTKSEFTEEDFSSHILVHLEDHQSAFKSLAGKVVKISSEIISWDEIGEEHTVKILFEEDFYKNDAVYHVICINRPLNAQVNPNRELYIPQLNSLKDCVTFLQMEIGDQRILKELDVCANKCNTASQCLENKSLQNQQEVVRMLCKQGIQIATKDFSMKNVCLDQYTMKCIALSVETYMLHRMHDNLISSISVICGEDDAELNKAIRNLNDIELCDLHVCSKFFDIIPRARFEMSRFSSETTPLGKLCRLRRTVHIMYEVKESVTTDDLLPVIIYLIIKVSLPNWVTQVTYARYFILSRESQSEPDEYGFILTTMEAAIQHIRSGALNICVRNLHDTNHRVDFLQLVADGKNEEISMILETSQHELANERTETTKQCHPLCSCEECERYQKRTTGTGKSPLTLKDNKGLSALHVSSSHGHLIITDLLLRAGACVDDTDYNGSTPLHLACKRGQHSIVLLLLDRGADINAQEDDKNSPLHLAAINGHEQCVKTLLYFDESHRNILDINFANGNGDTPLHNAARWGYVSIVKLLVQYGGLLNIRNKHKLTPLECSHNLVIRRLLEEFSKQQYSSRKYELKNTSCLGATELSETCATISNADVASSLSSFPNKVTADEKNVKLLRAIADNDVNLACYYLGVDNHSDDSLENNVNQLLCHPLCQCEKCQELLAKRC